MTEESHDTDSPEDKPKDLANTLTGMVFVALAIAVFVVEQKVSEHIFCLY